MNRLDSPAQRELLQRFRQELQTELPRILTWWSDKMVDKTHGGFLGQMDHFNKIHPNAPKGLVLNARILWAFSAGARYLHNDWFRKMADRAYRFLTERFIDRQYGGAYWSLTANGLPLDTRKQIYGLGFAIYGLAEYYRLSGEEQALETAIQLFEWIEKHSFDPVHGGYFEAVNRQGEPLADQSLSDKDMNVPKSMNTHLHIIEGYANLYRVWKNEKLAAQIDHLLDVFQQRIIAPDTKHLILFFSEDWQAQSDIISYGHDIEAAWLLLECAEILGKRIDQCKRNALAMALAASEGLDGSDGGLWCENHLHEKHWWVQAEAMVGFLNAWQLNRGGGNLEYAHGCWRFIQTQLMDKRGGEWWWGLKEDGSLIETEDKAGFWKCPYHNTRACMEAIDRIGRLLE